MCELSPRAPKLELVKTNQQCICVGGPGGKGEGPLMALRAEKPRNCQHVLPQSGRLPSRESKLQTSIQSGEVKARISLENYCSDALRVTGSVRVGSMPTRWMECIYVKMGGEGAWVVLSV